MKKLSLLLAIAAAATALSAQAEISGSVDVVSSYIWRGLSYTGGAAVQGGVEYGHDLGVYAGTWTSNIDGAGPGNEIDMYVGWGMELDNSLTFDAQIINYDYTNNEGGSYQEGIVTVGMFGVHLMGAAPSDRDIATYDYYVELGYEGEFAGLGLEATYGYFPEYNLNKAASTGQDASDFLSVGISQEVGGIDLSMVYYQPVSNYGSEKLNPYTNTNRTVVVGASIEF